MSDYQCNFIFQNKPKLTEPIDYETAIVKNKTWLDNDPNREMLFFPKDDISVKLYNLCTNIHTPYSCVFGLAGIILCVKFAFVSNFYPPNKSQNFKSMACWIEISSIDLRIKFVNLVPIPA